MSGPNQSRLKVQISAYDCGVDVVPPRQVLKILNLSLELRHLVLKNFHRRLGTQSRCFFIEGNRICNAVTRLPNRLCLADLFLVRVDLSLQRLSLFGVPKRIEFPDVRLFRRGSFNAGPFRDVCLRTGTLADNRNASGLSQQRNVFVRPDFLLRRVRA